LFFVVIGNYSQAITYYDKALAIDPKNVLAIIGKGYALDNIGNHTKAVMYYDKALAIDPRYIADLTHKGNFLIGIGNYKLAIMYFDKGFSYKSKEYCCNNGQKTGP
jgi:tetratricopeptide (TPR) repeat protein